ncbi:MAG: AAA family ATPase, partial [Acidimicrobiales bacterium]
MAITEPPYTPGFGRQPPTLAGREVLIAREMRALRAGPAHPEFCVAYLGRRGVGKTTMLDSIAAQVQSDLGWATLQVQAIREESLLLTIAQRMPASLRPWGRLGRDFKRFEAELQVSVNLGVVSASATVRSGAAAGPTTAPSEFENLLRRVGEFAQRNGTGLLISIDEAQSSATQDLAGLARAAQTVVSRSQLPVAL